MIHQDVTLAQPIINWTWFLVGDYNDLTLTFTIKRHYRLHNQRDADEHPRADGGFRLVEGEGRIAVGVDASFSFPRETIRLTVTNPAHVFSYPGE